MAIANYPKGFTNGVAIRNIPIDISNPGKVFWVNNSTVLADGGIGGSNGNPGTYHKPFATLDYAIGRCTANRGDVIYVMPGYTQTMAAANAVDVDVAGVSIIGLGPGTKRPTFTYTVAAGEFVIGADDVHIENLLFVPGVTAVTTAIDVEANSDRFEIVNCEFSGALTTTVDEFLAAISVGITCNNGLIQGCFFDSEVAGAVYAISLATPLGVKIIGNTIMGDYSTACVGTITGAGVKCHMYNNVMINGLPGNVNAVACFTQSAAGTWGGVGDNLFCCDVATAILFFTNYTSTINLGNVYTDDTTMAATAVSTTATIVAMADG